MVDHIIHELSTSLYIKGKERIFQPQEEERQYNSHIPGVEGIINGS